RRQFGPGVDRRRPKTDGASRGALAKEDTRRRQDLTHRDRPSPQQPPSRPASRSVGRSSLAALADASRAVSLVSGTPDRTRTCRLLASSPSRLLASPPPSSPPSTHHAGSRPPLLRLPVDYELRISVIVVGGHSPSDPMKTPSSNQRFFQSISFGDCAGWTKTVQPKQKDPTISKTRGAAYVPPTRDCSLWLSHA
ncbi:hypothetical protein THAOC_20079, partial [Thalassiosira oceanica]